MRLRKQTPTNAGEVPGELARFVLADWADEDDWSPAPDGSQQPPPVPHVERDAVLRHRAWGRFVEARRAWADERGVGFRDLPRICSSQHRTDDL